MSDVSTTSLDLFRRIRRMPGDGVTYGTCFYSTASVNWRVASVLQVERKNDHHDEEEETEYETVSRRHGSQQEDGQKL